VWNVGRGPRRRRSTVISFKQYEHLQGGARDVQWGRVRQRSIVTPTMKVVCAGTLQGLMAIWSVTAGPRTACRGALVPVESTCRECRGNDHRLDAQTGRKTSSCSAACHAAGPSARIQASCVLFQARWAGVGDRGARLCFSYDLATGAMSTSCTRNSGVARVDWFGRGYILPAGV